MNSRSKSRHSTSVALSQIGSTFLNREARSLLIYDLAILWISSRESESRGTAAVRRWLAGRTMLGIFHSLGRWGDPSSHQPPGFLSPSS